MAGLMARRIVICVVAGVLSGVPLKAQSPLTLERAEELYLARNPLLQAARDAIEAARGRRQQTGAWANPLFNYSQENFPVGADNVRFFDDQEFAIGGSQLFELGGKREHRQAIAEGGIALAQAELEDLIRLGTARVRETFLAAVFAQKRVDFATQQLQSYYEIRDIHRKRFEAGDVSGLSQARIDLEEVRFLATRNRASNDLNAMWSELAAAIGWTETQPGTPQWQPGDEILGHSLEQLNELALQSRPDLRVLAHREEQSQRRTQLERARRTPDLTVGGGYKRDFGVNSFYASVTLPIPVFNRNSGAISEAEAQLRRVQNQRLWTRLMVRAEVERFYRTYTEQADTVRSLRSELLRKAESALQATQVSFQEGEASLMDYLDALRMRLDASLSFYELQFQFERSRVQLERAVGADLQ